MAMKNIWRNVLRILLGFFGLNAFTACYGVASYSPYVSIWGKVVDENDVPVKGIKVSGVNDMEAWSETSEQGEFGHGFFCDADEVPQTLTFKFTDPDGPDNGGEFEDKTVTVNLKEQASQPEPMVVKLSHKK